VIGLIAERKVMILRVGRESWSEPETTRSEKKSDLLEKVKAHEGGERRQVRKQQGQHLQNKPFTSDAKRSS